tara:strand:- start:236 stop:421 length:186 start_codon:yes stop_codon:yes gene_type:complete
MQLRLRQRKDNKFYSNRTAMKIIFGFFVFFLAIFLLDKIEVSKPNKLIKQQISNDKLITIK